MTLFVFEVMVRKKSVASKVKTRKESYKRKMNHLKAVRSWKILILVMRAVKIFLDRRRDARIAASLPPSYGVLEPYFVPSNCVGFRTRDVQIVFPQKDNPKDQFAEFKIVQDILKKLVSKVCRLEHDKKRKADIRKKKKDTIENENVNSLVLKRIRQRKWLRKKYRDNIIFHKKKNEYVKKKFSQEYKRNNSFRTEHITKMKRYYQANTRYRENLKMTMNKQYQENFKYREYKIKQSNSKYHMNVQYRENRKRKIQEKYHMDVQYHENRKRQIQGRYHMDVVYRENRKRQIHEKYHTDIIHCQNRKHQMREKYHKNTDYREKRKHYIKRLVLKRYYNDLKFRNMYNINARIRFFTKYHCDKEFRRNYRKRINDRFRNKYQSNSSFRLIKIQQTLKHYQITSTPIRQYRKRIYEQGRRIMKKYKANQRHTCRFKHMNLYRQSLREFKEKNKQGPDFICVSCGIRFFRQQVIPYIEENYLKKNMSYEDQAKVRSYVNHPLIMEKKWICRYCSDKIKKNKMPGRCIANKLDVSDIPSELKNLNNLEKHLIALRLPFLKVVNLSCGKISGKFAQKGTKGPLHCVPSDVEETVTTLPRPIDKSLMIRLQLKRRLKYKAIWEEQFINPNDVRNALIVLTKKHPNYRNITINEIDENYIVSDKFNNNPNLENETIEPMDIESTDGEFSFEKTLNISDDLQIQRLSLGDIDNNDQNDEEVIEDHEDIRSKYNIGTDSCTQPSDFNDFLCQNKDTITVAPAEKNNLSSLLTDKAIEGLAFPHLFPDGKGTFNEERVTDLKWKEYCKTRLFSSDSRFASDSTYIFYLQYLGDLKQVFSSINVAFRKKLPMTVRHALDESQMKFLMNKDMIYRYLQSVRGSPQYWLHRLKELFGMTRQLGFPTFFLTLSCADIRWKEFIDIFARHSGEKVKDSYTYEEKTKLLRANPVLAARLFENRFTRFMNMFVKGGCWCLGKVKDWYARIEMQFRGSPHAHMPIWVEDAPQYHGVDTNEETRQHIVDFCDKYITTKYPSIEEDLELHNIVKEVQTHSRNHSKSCLKYHKTMCRFGFPRPIAYRTFICEPIKINSDEDKERSKRAKEILREMNATLNELEKEKTLSRYDFDSLLSKFNWTYDDYEWALRVVHTRIVMIHKREPNARWVNQYNEEMLRAWNANMDLQFILDSYACAKYLMSYTTKPEREMSLLLEETHKECREGNMNVRDEMKKLTGTFFNHRQVSVQEAIFRACKMPLVYSSRGFVFVPSHSNSCKFLKPARILKEMDPDDENIYMSNLADKYFDRPDDPELDICLADFASEFQIVSAIKKAKNPRTPIKYLKTLNFAIKKRCVRNAIIRFPYFNRETDTENYFENILCLYLPIRSRDELKQPYELFYETADFYDTKQKKWRKVKEVVIENRKKYEKHYTETEEMESIFNSLSNDANENEWAKIVADREKERQWLIEIENEDNVDLNIIHNKKQKNTFFDLNPRHISTNEIRPMLDSLNEEQQQIFYYVREWCFKRLHNSDVEPLRLFITGGAGTGKSHLLKCLHHEAMRIFSRKKHLEPDENIDEIHTLITAFTGAAAVNVGGVTIHSAFGIGTQQNSQADNLSCDKLNSYRCKLGSLKLLFVDEVSLIQSNLWGAMHSRLTQIMGIHSNTAIFGNVAIIAIGDFYQCAPVASQGIYSSLLWSDHFEYVELKLNERQKTNACFSQMLNRIRKLKKNETMTDEDRTAIENCHQRYLNKEYHPEALHLFAKNISVDEHNNKMLDKICKDIRTCYEIDHKGREIGIEKNNQKTKVLKVLRIAKDARVILTKNICVNDGLANGVIARVIDFIENENKKILRIVIKCDSSTIGRIHRDKCPYCKGKDTICVTRESDTNDRQDTELNYRKTTKQFPLRLSWAITIHKAQGITVDEIVISTKDLFGTGMGYTALSRVRTQQGLFLSDLHPNKIYCNEHIDTILTQMKTFKEKPMIFQNDPKYLNMLCHNIEGLKNNFQALTNHYLTNKADVICLCESWLNQQNDEYEHFQIQGFTLFSKTRFDSFESSHPLKSKKGGGVAIYVKENISTRQFDLSQQLNLEYTSIEIDVEQKNITIITCYRSPQQNKTEFLANLVLLLEKINIDKNIILVGDFNEDSLSDETKPIEIKLKSLGFENMFKQIPTTKNLTSLDCVYSNFVFKNERKKDTIGTYYSYHDELVLSINVDNELNEVNTNSLEYDENQMEVDSSLTCPNHDQDNRNNTNKRQREETDINSSKKSKTTSNFRMNKEKKLDTFNDLQIRFLTNTKETINIRDILTPNTVDPCNQLRDIGLKIIAMKGDGNCFFRTLSHQIFGEQSAHMEIRLAAIEYMRCNRDKFEQFLVEEEYPNMNSYMKEMSKNGIYVDNLIIMATAIVIEKNLIIHKEGETPMCIPGSDFIDNQIHLWYTDNQFCQHYDSVVSVANKSPFLPIEQLAFR